MSGPVPIRKSTGPPNMLRPPSSARAAAGDADGNRELVPVWYTDSARNTMASALIWLKGDRDVPGPPVVNRLPDTCVFPGETPRFLRPRTAPSPDSVRLRSLV